MKPLLIGVLLSLVIACSHTAVKEAKKIDIAKGVSVKLPKVGSFLNNIELQQVVRGTYPNGARSFQVVLRGTAKKLNLVAYTSWGAVLYRTSYTGSGIQSSALINPEAKFNPEYALMDMVFCYASIQVLRSSLPKGSVVTDSESSREISVKGKKIIEIKYDGKDRLSSNLVYKNLSRKYSLEIKTISRRSL